MLVEMATMSRDRALNLRHPVDADGAGMWELARDAGTLDSNSPYCYFLHCKHHPRTCVVAEEDGRLLGFVMGYRPPGQPDTLFVWQIGVHSEARRRGLGKRMLRHLLEADVVRYLEASVTPSNQASQRLFRSIARDYGTECRESVFLPSELFAEGHESEHLLRIGPLGPTHDFPAKENA